jgi:hypothetical protein
VVSRSRCGSDWFRARDSGSELHLHLFTLKAAHGRFNTNTSREVLVAYKFAPIIATSPSKAVRRACQLDGLQQRGQRGCGLPAGEERDGAAELQGPVQWVGGLGPSRVCLCCCPPPPPARAPLFVLERMGLNRASSVHLKVACERLKHGHVWCPP